MKSNEEHIARLKIYKVTNNENGTSTLHFDLDKEFIEWFKEKEGLKRFSHKRFQKFVSDTLSGNKENITGVIVEGQE